MAVSSLWRRIFGAPNPAPSTRSYKPQVERLEERVVPAWTVNNLTTLTPTALVKDLIGNNVSFSNVSFTGAKVAAGIFTDTNSTVGLKTGVALSSGGVKGLPGPNNNSAFTTINNTPGDAQLNAIIAPQPGFDASVLQFDFVPTGGILSFQYVFGSEEYPVFVGSINDVFAFFLDGKNVALIPGTNQPVSINNVSPVTNTQFYVNNFTNPAGPIFGPHDTQMNGYTVVLPVTVSITPGVTHHIKLAIENASDQLLDSWVLIKAGSIGSSTVATYTPLRFNYQPATHLYTGDVTAIDYGTAGLGGPLFLVFTQLPPGVTLVNKTGNSPSGFPYIPIPGGLPGNTPVRVFVQFTDPFNVNLGTFFLHDPIQLEVKLT